MFALFGFAVGLLAAEPLQPAARLAAALDRLEKAAQTLPRDSFDPGAVIKEAGNEPAQLLAWMRDHTRFVPYLGALRGPQGVLMDRVGNDLDRALLLGQLLAQSGHGVRLASAELDDATVAARLAEAAAKPLPEASRSEAAPALISLHQRADTQAGVLVKLLPPADSTPGWDSAQLDGARTHWWVQYQRGDEWVDLDPAAPAGQPGQRLGENEAALTEWSDGDIVGSLPESLCHEVVLRAVIERWNGERLEEIVAHEVIVRTARQPASHVYFTHQLPKAAAARMEAAKTAEEKSAALLAQKSWRPMFVLGQRAQGAKAFDDAGTLAVPAGGAVELGQAMQGGFGFFGEGSEEPNSAAPGSVLIAEFLEVVVRAPGRAETVERRIVFDVLTAAERARAAEGGALQQPSLDTAKRLRRAAALNAWSDNHVTSARWPLAYYAHATTSHLLAARDTLIAATAASERPGHQALRRHLFHGDSLEMFALVGAFRCTTADSTYLDRPGVTRLILQEEFEGNRAMGIWAHCDLAFNPAAALEASPVARFRQLVTRGVADSLAERVVVGAWPPPEPEALPVEPENAGDIFRLAAKHEIAPTLLRAGAEPEALWPTLAPAVRALVVADLQAGHHIVIPAKSVADNRIGWWCVNAATGETVGVMDNGLHGDMAEYGKLEEEEGIGDTFVSDKTLPSVNSGGTADANWLAKASKVAEERGFARLSPEWFATLDEVFAAIHNLGPLL